MTIEVEVPFELHRYIIGQKGSGIRKMMDEFEVRNAFFGFLRKQSRRHRMEIKLHLSISLINQSCIYFDIKEQVQYSIHTLYVFKWTVQPCSIHVAYNS